MIDVANQLGLLSYLYFTSGAGFLGLMLPPSTRHSQIGTEFEDSDPDLELPSFVNPVPIRVLPEALEPYAVESFANDRVDHSKIIGWLDAQLELSVVFLCFGSMGTFDAPQVREIALRLERRGHRLSWASAEAGWQTRWKL
ncbi:Anthocyanidin 3-O-glucosyltransferase 2 [Vitis vinifera]|uniref:Anthocyanidin 3-O-glucosyltransferase 2 n=1 Tax=Vitis vinifera TaxID=29760 RepID=A0A438G1D9_VITVI|nr:Anthocyanidin 3-O-glucosyltransferase 2 [Vitis vinifera]